MDMNEENGAPVNPSVENDVAQISLYFTFYEESNFKVRIKSTYSFTQTHPELGDDILGMGDQKESKLFTQEFKNSLTVRSIQPFVLQWGLVKPSDSFLKVADSDNSAAKTTVSQDQKDAQILKTGLGKNFKVWCKLRNRS